MTRPWGVTAICVVAIILGGLGLLAAAGGAAAQALQPKFSALQPDPKMAELNAEFERRIYEATGGLKTLYWALLPFAFAASGLLVAGGIKGLGLKGRALLGTAFWAGIAVDAASAALGAATQLKSAEAMRWYADEIAAKFPMQAGATAALKMGATVGIAFAAAWLLAKVAYYVTGIIALRRPAVRAAFGSPAPTAP